MLHSKGDKIYNEHIMRTFMRSVEIRYCAMLLTRISKKNQMCLRNLLTISWSAWFGLNDAFRYCASSSCTVFCFGPVTVSVMNTYWNRSCRNTTSLINLTDSVSHSWHTALSLPLETNKKSYSQWAVDISGWLHTEMVYPPTDGHPSKY